MGYVIYMHRRHSRRRSRCRRPDGVDDWAVRARVERFAEPAILLLLRERPAHGYDLLEQLPALVGERVDMGNLYRFLRALEDDGILRSRWQDDLPGPSKRTYELTDSGRRLLQQWVAALARARDEISAFLERHERKEVTSASP